MNDSFKGKGRYLMQHFINLILEPDKVIEYNLQNEVVLADLYNFFTKVKDQELLYLYSYTCYMVGLDDFNPNECIDSKEKLGKEYDLFNDGIHIDIVEKMRYILKHPYRFDNENEFRALLNLTDNNNIYNALAAYDSVYLS